MWARDDNIHPWEFKKTRYRERQRVGSQPSREPTLFDRSASIEPCQADGCVGYMVERRGKFGSFFGCSEFRSEEHTSELQSLMRISYAVFCLKTTTSTQTTISSRSDLQSSTN